MNRSKQNRLKEPWYYTVNRALATIVPLGLAYWVSVPIADIFYGLWRSKRETARRNYSRILQDSSRSDHAERLSRQCFRHFGKYVVELLHVQGWSVERLREMVDIEGEEHFEEARAYGRGVIFTSGHMGSIEVASALLLLKGYRITSVAEQLRPKLLMDWMVTCRQNMGVTLLPAAGSAMRLVRALRKNEMVALVVDVGVNNGDGRPVQFFGHETYFPTGPSRLARISGAPILFGLAVRKPNNRFAAYVSPPFFANRELDPEEDAQVTTQRIVDELARFVRKYPEQWYVFRDMWSDDGWSLRGADPL